MSFYPHNQLELQTVLRQIACRGVNIGPLVVLELGISKPEA